MRDDEGVGGGVQVGHVHVHLLVLQAGDWVDLGHEEDQVAGVNVVAQAVDDEEEVGPVLGGAGHQGGGDHLLLLLHLWHLLRFWHLLLLWLLLLLLLVGFLLLWLFLLGLLLLLLLAVSVLDRLGIAIGFGLWGFRNLLNFLRFFLFGSARDESGISGTNKFLSKVCWRKFHRVQKLSRGRNVTFPLAACRGTILCEKQIPIVLEKAHSIS